MQAVVKLRNVATKFSYLITCGELLREGLEKKIRGLEREKVGLE